MIRALQILDNITAGGIQSFIMNVYRNIDRECIQFDFLVHHKHEKSYEEEIKSKGGRVFYLPARSDGILKNRKALNSFFKKYSGEYAVVHFHESSLTYLEPLMYATKYNVPIRIMHSHSTKVPRNKIHLLLHKVNKKKIGKYATNYVACGQMAGEWMYGGSSVANDVTVIYNGIDISKYEFNEEKRKQIRYELGLKDEFVIGHVGRFEPVKNHKFLLEVMKSILEINSNTVLLLVGNGRTFEKTKDYAKELGIQSNVRFLGIRNDADMLYQAMDLMILPSLYEGFPITAIEAEASGLPCILSDSITKEALLKENVKYISLSRPQNEWARLAINNSERIIDNTILYNKGFDITSTVEQLGKLYLECE